MSSSPRKEKTGRRRRTRSRSEEASYSGESFRPGGWRGTTPLSDRGSKEGSTFESSEDIRGRYDYDSTYDPGTYESRSGASFDPTSPVKVGQVDSVTSYDARYATRTRFESERVPRRHPQASMPPYYYPPSFGGLTEPGVNDDGYIPGEAIDYSYGAAHRSSRATSFDAGGSTVSYARDASGGLGRIYKHHLPGYCN